MNGDIGGSKTVRTNLLRGYNNTFYNVHALNEANSTTQILIITI